MKKTLLLSSLLLLTVSCKFFKGQLNVHQEISLKNDKSMVSIAAGEYESSVNFSSKKKAELKINGQKFKLKFDSKLKIPSNGSFTIKAADWNQNYDLAGTVKTQREVGPLRNEYESCIDRIPYTVCDRRGNCRVVYRDFYGRRHAEYRMVTILESIVFNLVKDNFEYATMNGADSHSEKRYEYTGPCR